MSKDDALKLAREMLIENREYIQMYERPSYLALYDKAIARVEEALASEANEQPAPVATPHKQQEPVARLHVLTDSLDMGQSLAQSRTYKTATATTYKAAMELPLGYYDLYTSPQPAQQQPVAVVSGYYGGQCVVLPTNPARIFNSGTAFYTSPPASKPLTDDDLDDIAVVAKRGNLYDLRLTIEAKLREKNA